MFEFTCEGRPWLVDDQYCVRPGCTCTEAGLSFFCLSDNGHSSAKRRRCLTALFYDYRAATFKVKTMRRGSPGPDLLLPALQAAHPGLAAQLARRHQQLQQISRRLWPKSSIPSMEAFSLLPGRRPVVNEPKTKVGRNEPCPCGSGKKFKKCCGRT
jgi:hypothetical protein